MADDTNDRLGPNSQELFQQVEEGLEPGSARDLWWGLRGELNEGGPGAVRTYLDAEFQGRETHLREEIQRLRTRFEELE